MALEFLHNARTFSRRLFAFVCACPRGTLLPPEEPDSGFRAHGSEVLSIHWRDGRTVMNFGDYITELLIRRFGYRYCSVAAARAQGRLNQFDRMIFGAGSMIDNYWLSKPGPRIEVWGSGYWGETLSADSLSRVTFLAVRGPVTRDRLGLPADIPLGDPGLLLPLFFPVTTSEGRSGSYFVAHFFSRFPSAAEVRSLGVDSAIDTRVTRETWLPLLRKLASARFVLTDSLHAAIVAQAYETPWALCLRKQQSLDKPLKWHDWFSYLRINNLPGVSNLSEGLEWWREIGAAIPANDLSSLLRACPLEIRDDYSKRCIEQYFQDVAS